MKANDIVILKLASSEQVMGTVSIPLVPKDQPPLWTDCVVLDDVGSVQVTRSQSTPNEFHFRLIPWMAGASYFALDKVVGVSHPNEHSQKEYERVFRKILTPPINEVVGLEAGPHGKM